MQFQERDFTILADIGEHGWMDTVMIHQRHWPADAGIRACQNRLKKLVEEGLLKSVRLVVSKAASTNKLTGGSLAMAFGLTTTAADAMERETGQRPKRVSRSELKELTLLHRLRTVSARLAIDAAATAAKIRQPSWIFEQDIVPDAKSGFPLHKRMVLFERFDDGRESITCRPDASCQIWIPKQKPADGSRPLLIYWEIDRSTNVLDAERQKVYGYAKLLETNRHFAHWSETKGQSPIVRIFYVCNSAERARNIANEVRDHPVAKAYRFSTHDELQNKNPLTDDVWSDIDGRLYAILKS